MSLSPAQYTMLYHAIVNDGCRIAGADDYRVIKALVRKGYITRTSNPTWRSWRYVVSDAGHDALCSELEAIRRSGSAPLTIDRTLGAVRTAWAAHQADGGAL